MINLTNINIQDRPLSSYSEAYLKNRKNILAYRAANKEGIADYMREYMKKRRLDPVKKFQEAQRIIIRKYITAESKRSPSCINYLGCNRETMAFMQGFKTEAEFIKWVRTQHIDHVIPVSYVKTRPDLKEFIWRWYNIRFVDSLTNSTKHSYVDEKDPATEWVLMQVEMEKLRYLSGNERRLKSKSINRRIVELEKIMKQK